MLFILLVQLSFSQVHAVCVEPEKMEFVIDDLIERKGILGFTQGLEMHGDLLYESTGAHGDTTKINTIDKSGVVKTLKDQGGKVFGEGLTVFKDQIYQLTWKNGRAYVYDLKGVQRQDLKYPREGWGLTNDGKKLISSDGGSNLAFHDPVNIQKFSVVTVRDHQRPYPFLNELEYVNGKVYANVYGRDEIVRIDPKSGCIEARADMSGLYKKMSKEQRDLIGSDPNFVLNGIAYDKSDSCFYLTGKKWPMLFRARLKK